MPSMSIHWWPPQIRLMMYNRYMAKISFVTDVEFLDSIEECKPKPAKNFIPEWFKQIPGNLNGTVKQCPSFPDFFSQGYVIPMWADVRLKHNKETDQWGWNGSSDSFSWDMHPNNQLIDYVIPTFNGMDGKFVFKANCPWKIITPPGWSVMQLPLFYHFNREWSIMPGIIDTDIHHYINQQVLYHGDKEEITINRGDPFVLYVPFKREKNSLDVRFQSEKDRKIFGKQQLKFNTKFLNTGSYRKMQRERDKDV